jgi:hypothetical protein
MTCTPTLQLATATYNFDVQGGTGPFELPLTIPIPKGSIVLSIMINILVLPDTPGGVGFYLGDPWYWNFFTNNPFSIPWSQGAVPSEVSVSNRATVDTPTMRLEIPTLTSGHWTMTFYFV